MRFYFCWFNSFVEIQFLKKLREFLYKLYFIYAVNEIFFDEFFSFNWIPIFNIYDVCAKFPCHMKGPHRKNANYNWKFHGFYDVECNYFLYTSNHDVDIFFSN